MIGKPKDNPTTRYRILPLMSSLIAEAHEVTFVESDLGFSTKLKLLLQASKTDVIIIQRKLFSIPFFYLLHQCCTKIIFDFDDAIYLRSNGQTSIQRESRFNFMIRRTWQVWAGNENLCKQSSRAGSKITHHVPTVIQLTNYPVEETNRQSAHLIWIGSKSTQRYLVEAVPMLEQLGKNYPELQLTIVCDFQFQVEHLRVNCIAWTKDNERQALQKASIGIAPMTDDPWTRGKCALKVLQYMAMALPVVTSKVGANTDVIEEGETGFACETIDEWNTAIGSLLEDADLSHKLGEAGRDRVEQFYQSEKWVTQQVLWLTEKS